MSSRALVVALCALASFLPVRAPVCAANAAPSPRTVAQASLNNPVATGAGDAIFALGSEGSIDPVAVRLHGKFLAPGSNDGGTPETLRQEAFASIATGGGRMHIVFGGRTVATVPARVENAVVQMRRQPLGRERRNGLRREHLPHLQPHRARLEERLRRRRRGALARVFAPVRPPSRAGARVARSPIVW